MKNPENEVLFFRRARIFDISKMHTIEKASFPTPWSFDALFSDAFLNANTLYYVAEYNGNIAGYGGMWIVIDEAHVTNVAIKSEYRRLGIGDKLMAHMESAARRNGAESMFLEVRQSNLAALSLYEKHGFQKIGVRPKYYTNPVEDAFIMRKELISLDENREKPL